ncbi:MAG: ATPase, T2SS/T4P/T4SS family [Oscillospiraceae bacterium]|nr:ATPase, T2SS/T4P/T4SS family [Oscillospiraceae bacterium]
MDKLSSIREEIYSTRGEEPYEQVLRRVQSNIASSLQQNIEEISEAELKEIIGKYITSHGVKCDLTSSVAELTNYIYHDMAGLSFITRDRLFEREGFEEIDINAWNNIEIVTEGKRQKTDYSFLSPQHAIDIHQRMFRKTGTIFNEAQPRATADIGDGIRITAQKCPIIDADIAVASSIRKVNMNVISREKLIEGKALNELMFGFLLLCVKRGVSLIISGETGAGKTTLAGCLLSIAAETLRIYTIEEGSREWNFVFKDAEGKPVNSVIHTRTRPNEENPSLNIDQESLVKDSLRFDPDIISPGEIRGREAFETMSVANTGHTVVTTIHSNSTLDTPTRVIALAKRAYDLSDDTLYEMETNAFPILVHTEKLSDNKRRITEIREVMGYENRKVQSRMLFEFVIEDNIYEGDVCTEVVGAFIHENPISESLAQRLLKKGARRAEIEPYIKFGRDNVCLIS